MSCAFLFFACLHSDDLQVVHCHRQWCATIREVENTVDQWDMFILLSNCSLSMHKNTEET